MIIIIMIMITIMIIITIIIIFSTIINYLHRAEMDGDVRRVGHEAAVRAKEGAGEV